MVVVLVQSASGNQFLRVSQLAVAVAVLCAGANLQGQSAIGPQLPLGAKSLWSLQQGNQQRRPDRPHVRNLPQLVADGMLATFHQQIVPGQPVQSLHRVQWFIESLGRSDPSDEPAESGVSQLGDLGVRDETSTTSGIGVDAVTLACSRQPIDAGQKSPCRRCGPISSKPVSQWFVTGEALLRVADYTSK